MFDWLPIARCTRWLKIEDGSPKAALVEDCRQAAADWCQSQRPDLIAGDPPTFAASPAIVQAGVLATARLYERVNTPAGLASYGEFGAAPVLRFDPDVARLLGVGPDSRTPRVG